MKKIVLFCSAGMSTSLLATKMQKSAKDKGIEVSIETLPEAQMEKRIDDDVDVVLLGPQIRYALRRAKKLCDEKKIPVDVINSVDYGMVDGEKVLEKVIKMMKK